MIEMLFFTCSRKGKLGIESSQLSNQKTKWGLQLTIVSQIGAFKPESQLYLLFFKPEFKSQVCLLFFHKTVVPTKYFILRHTLFKVFFA